MIVSQATPVSLLSLPTKWRVGVGEVVPNLVFLYSGGGFAPLDPILQSINWGGVRREVASED